jgi:hypothetical protein
MDIHCGGIGLQKDESLKIKIDTHNNDEKFPAKLVTFDDIKFDCPYKDHIAGIEMSCMAGDVMQFRITYYSSIPGEIAFTEEIYPKNFTLSFESSSRTAVSNDIIPEFERKRRMALGLEKHTISYKDSKWGHDTIKVIKN